MSSDSTADIGIYGVTKRFADTTAVDDLTLEIARGQFFALVGPSGCGKTTTLRMIGGFEDPTAGKITLGGHDVTELPPFKRDVNTVFQSYALFPHMTVEKNIAFGLERKKLPKADVKRRVGEIIELTELGGMEQRKAAQLSGGQQQRVALARALVNEPQALLLDEPLGALDLKLRRQLQIQLKRIQQEVGITFLHVTHDQEEAMTMADEIAVMNNGRIEQRGGAAELYELPKTEFVANFLGTSNIFDVTLGPDSGAEIASLQTVGGAVLRAPADRLPADTTALRAGVRPEKVKLTPLGEAGGGERNSLQAVVRLASFLGTSLQYVLETKDGTEITAIVQNSGTGGPGLGPGTEVEASWLPEHTFVVEQPSDQAVRSKPLVGQAEESR